MYYLIVRALTISIFGFSCSLGCSYKKRGRLNICTLCGIVLFKLNIFCFHVWESSLVSILRVFCIRRVYRGSIFFSLVLILRIHGYLRAKENEALLSGSEMTFAGWRGNMEMTRQRFCTNAEKLYNCNLISQLQKKCTTAISFHNCKILRRNNRKKCTTAIPFHKCKKIAQL